MLFFMYVTKQTSDFCRRFLNLHIMLPGFFLSNFFYRTSFMLWGIFLLFVIVIHHVWMNEGTFGKPTTSYQSPSRDIVRGITWRVNSVVCLIMTRQQWNFDTIYLNVRQADFIDWKSSIFYENYRNPWAFMYAKPCVFVMYARPCVLPYLFPEK